MIAIIKRRWTRWAAAVVAGWAVAGPAAAQQGPPPIHTKNAALRLPVLIDERARAAVAEIRLYVRPATGPWQLVKTLPATATAFDFKADADGAYAFSFVAVDRQGKADTGKLNAMPPDRIVVVDTKAPEISAQPIPLRGERFLQVHVRDQNPDWTSLRVAYLAPDQSWQPLMADRADTPTVFRVPNVSVLEGKIKISAADRAGNVTTRDLDLGDPTANFGFSEKSAVAQGKPDPALFPKTDVDSPVPPIKAPLLDPLPPIRPVDYQTPVKVPEPIKTPVIRNGLSDLPPIPEVPPLKRNDLPVIRNGGQPAEPTLSDVKPLVPTIPDLPNVPPPAVAGKEDLRLDAPADSAASGIVQTSALKPIELPRVANFPKAVELPKEIAIPTPPPIPEPVFEAKSSPTHTILNSRTLTINYQVEGTRGDKRIDFWATADGGKSWIALRDDAAGVAPAKLTLPADGFYGIRIRPGAGSKPPEVGEDPDCVVEIDSTKPTVNLMQPTIGTGSDDGTMLITWTASDKNLLSNSVNLSYATKPDGPWDVIVSGYKNAGLYRWTMPSHLSGNVYVRLEVSDRAGNVGIHDLKSPVALETIKPRVKVLGVGAVK